METYVLSYTVTLTGGANATRSGGDASQTVSDEMTAVTYTANAGYHFESFTDIENNGITATRTSDTTVTVSGTPTANASITIPDAVADPASAPTIDSVMDTTLVYGYSTGSVSVSATSESGHTLSFEWYDNDTTNSTSGGALISAATGESCPVPVGKDAGTYYLYCVVTATRDDNGQTATAISRVATVTVTQAAGSISFNTSNVEKEYLDAAFTNPLTNTGDGDVTYESSDSGIAAVDTNGQVTVNAVGTATITATVADSTNYTYAVKTATYTVEVSKAGFTPAVSIADWTYGDPASSPTVTGNTSGGEVTYQYKFQDTADNMYVGQRPTNAGDYTVKATIAETADYASQTATANFKIDPKPITVTADNQSKTYGGADPALTYTVSAGGLVGSDTLSGITVSRASGEDVGTYTITASQSAGANPNYNITFEEGILTISAKSITPDVSLDPDTFVYNRATQFPTVSVFYQGADLSASDYEVSYSTDGSAFTAAADSSDVGTYYIKVVAKSGGNYSFSDVTKTYTITPKSIDASMITLTDESYVFDDTEKQPTVTVKDGSATLTAAEYEIDTVNSTTNATAYGTYPIVVNGKGNYSGSATVTWRITKKQIPVTISGVETDYDGTPHQLSVTIPSGATITYGLAAGSYNLSGNPTYTNAGNYTIYYKVELDENYEPLEGSKTVTINRKAVTLTVTNKTKTYGDADPVFDYTASGLVNGDTLMGITLTRTAGENVGAYPITATVNATQNKNYLITNNEGTLTITKKTISPTVDDIESQDYTGSEVTPEVVVKNEGEILPSTAYHVAYSNNIAVGTATVTITNTNENYQFSAITKNFKIVNRGKIEVVDPETPNDNDGQIAEDASSVKAKVPLTDAEKEKYEDGKDIKIFLEVQDISETVAAEDKAKVEEVAGTRYKIGEYLDISLFKQVTGESKVHVTETNGTIQISLEIPADIRKDGRSYFIVRVHDGAATLITTVRNSNTLTFATNKFSTYAIVYTDVQPAAPAAAATTMTTGAASKPASTTTVTNAFVSNSVTRAMPYMLSPKTGDAMPVPALVVLMLIAAGVLAFREQKKRRG